MIGSSTRCGAAGLVAFCSVCSLALPMAAQALPVEATPDLGAYVAFDSVVAGNIVASSASPDTYLPVTVQMHNIGAQTITAYRISLAVRYPDGTDRKSVV